MKKIRKYWEYVRSLPSTFIFNFWYFPITVAIRFPIFVSYRCSFIEMSGNVSLPNNRIRMGMIKLGFGQVGIFEPSHSKMIWEVSGNVNFLGHAYIGHGSKLVVGKSGNLLMGDNFNITAESAIICMDKISIGNNVLISWDVLIMDTDFHSIYDQSSQCINPNSKILIGNKVWVGCRSLILKGSVIPNGVIVAASSTVSRNNFLENSIVGGNPAQVLKEKISWEM